jgi:excisionase family DNA binding protein
MGYWAPYVPAAKRRAQAAKHVKSMKAKGKALNPIEIVGRQIANTFWGKAWCDHLENYSDYENRLPRGRTYVRNGSVIDLQVSVGKIHAKVMGSYLYEVDIKIKPMSSLKWKSLVKACMGKIDSLVELLQGKFSDGVMAMIIDQNNGLFPRPNEIEMECSCPDGVGMCKHTAAVLYGIGASLDRSPEYLFTLRHVDHLELIVGASAEGIIAPSRASTDALEESALSSLFGIEMAEVTKPLVVKEVVRPKSKKAEEQIELSVLQAAVLLKISKSHLLRLLDDKIIVFRESGKQRWIAFEEIIKYRKNRKKS